MKKTGNTQRKTEPSFGIIEVLRIIIYAIVLITIVIFIVEVFFPAPFPTLAY